MTKAQGAAYVMAQAIACQCEMKAMLVANEIRANDGKGPAYGEEQFNSLIEKYGVHHNALLTIFENCTED